MKIKILQAGALFSDDRQYRYSLWRQWDDDKFSIMFIGLNPSTADETTDDPTVRRCIDYAQRWGYGMLFMANIFAYRATDPSVMKTQDDPIGERNDQFLRWLKVTTKTQVACWGNHGKHLNRGFEVGTMLRSLHCFGMTKAGQPKHPLYLPKSAELIRLTVLGSSK